jgi:sugar-phosphatase
MAPTSRQVVQPAAPAQALFDRTFDAVLFDMDGTLIDSLASVERSWLTWAAEFAIAPERLVGWHGVPARQIATALVAPADVAAAVGRIEQIETADVEGIVVLPGAVESLLAVGDRGAVVTSCTGGLASARIAATGLPVPGVVVTASDVEHGKPAPDPYLLGARRLGVDPERCLVIEDAVSGVRAGRAAGCVTLGVLTGHPDEDLDADVVVDSLAAVRFTLAEDGVRVLRRAR